MPMCRLTSQMKPNSAQISVAENSMMLSATHGGRLNLFPPRSAMFFNQVMRLVRC